MSFRKEYYKQQGGLGNFVHLTPAFQRLHERDGFRVKVHFKKPYVKACFLDADFIQHVEGSHEWDLRQILMLNEYDKERILNDYDHSYEVLTGESYDYTYHTYVDTPSSGTRQRKPYFVLLNGGAEDKDGYFLQKKMTKRMLDQIAFANQVSEVPLVFVGSEYDYESTIKASPILGEVLIPIIDDIRDGLFQISHAEKVISNDTGLYHCASAMKKDILVSTRVPLRADRLPSRCIYTPNDTTRYVDENQWKREVEHFMNN